MRKFKKKDENKGDRIVPFKEFIWYGVSSGGQAFGVNMLRNQLTFFLVTIFGVPAGAVATMILVMGFWDAINDPLMGGIIDRTKTKWGKFRPYILFGPIPFGILTVLYWGGPIFLEGYSDFSKIVFMCVVYFLWEFFNTMTDIPFWAMSASISPSSGDRTLAITFARAISGIIGVAPSLLIPICIDLTKQGAIPFTLPQVFFALGLFAGTIGMVLFSMGGIFVKERVPQPSNTPKIIDSFKLLFKNKPLLLLTCFQILTNLGNMGYAFTQYYYALTLGIASISILVDVVGVICAYIVYALMPKIESKFNPINLMRIVVGGKAVVSTIVFLIGCGDYTNKALVIPLLAIQSTFASSVGSINNVIPSKMMCDTVDYMEWKHGTRSEGAMFSASAFASKISSSLITSIATSILPLIGLSQVGSDMVLTEGGTVNTHFWLWAIITIIPNVLNLISLIPLHFYNLTGDNLTKIRDDLKVRREAAAIGE